MAPLSQRQCTHEASTCGTWGKWLRHSPNASLCHMSMWVVLHLRPYIEKWNSCIKIMKKGFLVTETLLKAWDYHQSVRSAMFPWTNWSLLIYLLYIIICFLVFLVIDVGFSRQFVLGSWYCGPQSICTRPTCRELTWGTSPLPSVTSSTVTSAHSQRQAQASHSMR